MTTGGAWERTGSNMMLEPAAADVLAEAGIAYPAHRFARTPDEAVAGAGQLGYPVVVKVVSPDVVHKSDVGGVATNIRNAAAVRTAISRIANSVRRAQVGATILGYLICEQVNGGCEVIVGALRDRTFGPTVMFGFGGIYAEVFGDVTFRVAPLVASDAREMLAEIAAFPVLSGVRGGEGSDLDSLTDMLVKASLLLVRRPDIAEFDLNPVCATQSGAIALDARIITLPARARRWRGREGAT